MVWCIERTWYLHILRKVIRPLDQKAKWVCCWFWIVNSEITIYWMETFPVKRHVITSILMHECMKARGLQTICDIVGGDVGCQAIAAANSLFSSSRISLQKFVYWVWEDYSIVRFSLWTWLWESWCQSIIYCLLTRSWNPKSNLSFVNDSVTVKWYQICEDGLNFLHRNYRFKQ